MTVLVRVLRPLLALTLGVAAGAGMLQVLDEDEWHPDDAAIRNYEAGPGDRVLDAVAGLADDHVHVSVDGRPMLDEDGEAAVAAALAERDLPVHVVVWRFSREAGYDHSIEAAEQIVAELDEPSVVVLWQGPEDSHVEATAGWRVDWRDEDDESVEVEPEYLGDAEQRLLEWIEQLPDEPFREVGED